jgi:hypothetical protein
LNPLESLPSPSLPTTFVHHLCHPPLSPPFVIPLCHPPLSNTFVQHLCQPLRHFEGVWQSPIAMLPLPPPCPLLPPAIGLQKAPPSRAEKRPLSASARASCAPSPLPPAPLPPPAALLPPLTRPAPLPAPPPCSAGPDAGVRPGRQAPHALPAAGPLRRRLPARPRPGPAAEGRRGPRRRRRGAAGGLCGCLLRPEDRAGGRGWGLTRALGGWRDGGRPGR